MKILIIEDEKELARDIKSFLASEDYLCESANNYADAIEKIHLHDYDCILLDLMLPGGDGIDILKEIKSHHKQDGVIIISAKDSIEDKVLGLKIGADDYLAKPFHQSELAARIHSVIRRKQFDSTNTIEQDEIRIDTLSKTVTVNDQQVILTKKEFDLLVFFVGNKNRVLSKEALAEHLSGDIADMFDNHDFVYAHIKNLKRKLKDAGCANYLTTVYGSGYKWKI
ncbi:MAG: response regulator transcription factor [Crocinitomicaceae bacterium]|nr:response regulator transcription factor [Crocinitomicaceae bacterium]